MKTPQGLFRFALVSATGLLLAGCLLKPTTVSVRRFVLAPLPASAGAPATNTDLALGIGLVKMPAYLLRNALALRKGTNELEYVEDALWAEPLDQGFQRTLAANLSQLLSTEQIYLSSWGAEQVKLRVFVNVEQFDVDTRGKGRLIAWWRLTAPGSEHLVKSGKADLTRSGPSPRGNPQAIVATLSALTGEFSRQLAEAIREAAQAGRQTGEQHSP
jgi:uncharacterized protein